MAENGTDVVLLDLSLPDSQGLDTFVRVHTQVPGVPIAVLTGLADETVAALSLREGAQDYLVKGQVDGNLLVRSMRYAIERMRAEEALRESEERYRTLFEDSRDAIFFSSPNGEVIDANQAALDLFGFTREEAIGSDVGERYSELADHERFRQVIGEMGSVRDFEVKLRKKNGTDIDSLLTASRRRPRGGTDPGGVQGIVRDISERKRAEETLLQQMRDLAVLEERNRMAREIHDTLAQGFTGIVLQLAAAEQVLEEDHDEVTGHLARAKSLARESLQEARRSVWGLVPHALEQQSLVEALQERVGQLNSTGNGTASFRTFGTPRELPVEVQASLLRICQESLTNVSRHSAATEVGVTLSFQPDSVGLKVQDNGLGFDQASARAEGEAGGFGLIGMEQRAHQLGGSFIVDSRKGHGTIIDVQVPTGQAGN